MKNKIFLTAVIACAFMFINCSDNTNKETTEISEDDETRVETVMTVSPSTTPEYKHKGLPKAPDNRGAVKYLAASSKPSPSFSTESLKNRRWLTHNRENGSWGKTREICGLFRKCRRFSRS